MRNEQAIEKLQAQYFRILEKMETMDPLTPEYEILARLAAQINAELNKTFKIDVEIYKEETLADCERSKVANQIEAKSKEMKQNRKEGWRKFWLDLGLGLAGISVTGFMWIASLILQDEVMQPRWYQNLQTTTKEFIRPRR